PEPLWIRAASMGATAANRSAFDQSLAFLQTPGHRPESELQLMASAVRRAVATVARSEVVHVALLVQLQDVRRDPRLRSQRCDPSAPDRSDAPQQAGNKP